MYGFAWLSAAAGLASLFFTMHLFQYLGLRVRNSALPDGEKDPQLGRKFVLHVFAHLSVLLILVGVTVSVIDVLDYVFEPNKNRMVGPGRGGFGPGGFNPPPPRGASGSTRRSGRPPACSRPASCTSCCSS